jgi:O-antigen/teichoic acid export membrane protein
VKRIIQNVAGLAMGDAASRLLGFFITVYLARLLSMESFGLVSVSFALLGQLGLVAAPGIQIVESRNVAARREGIFERTRDVLGLRLALSITLLCIAALVVAVVRLPVGTTMLAFLCSMLPLAMFLDWHFQGMERGVLVGSARFIQSAVYGIVVLALVHSSGDVNGAALSFFIGSASGALFLFVVFARSATAPWPRWNPKGWRDILRDNAPVGGAVILAQLVVNYPPLIIGGLIGAKAAGLWGAAMKLVFLVLMLDRVLATSFLPLITRVLTQRPDDARLVFQSVLKLVVAAAIPVVFVGWVFAGDALRLVFGEGYAEGTQAFQLLMGYVFLTLVNSVFVATLIGGGHERMYMRSIAAGSLLLVVVVTLLIPFAGLVGAAIGVVIGELFTVALTMRGVLRRLSFDVALPVWSLLAATGLMVVVLVLARAVPSFVIAPAAVVVYLLCASGMRVITLTELRTLRRKIA